MATVRRSVLALVGLAMLLLAVSLPRLVADAEGNRRGNGVTVLPVETLVAQLSNSFELDRQYTGQVVARRSSDLGFELAGRVEEISVEEGDRVESGQNLAKLTQMDRRRVRGRKPLSDAIIKKARTTGRP